MGQRAWTALLALGLLVLASVLAGVSAESPHREGELTTVTVTPTASPAEGKLLVSILQAQGTTVGSISLFPIADVNVTLSQYPSDSVLSTKQTNSSGELGVILPVGRYTAALSYPEFHGSSTFAVEQNATTDVNATVTKHNYPAVFTDIQDPEASGSLTPWSPVTMAVSTQSAPPLNGSLFIDGSYGTGANETTVTFTTVYPPPTPLTLGSNSSRVLTESLAIGPVDTPVKLVSANAGTYEGTEVDWLTLQPQEFSQWSGFSSLDLATYTVSLEVTIAAT
jgi:hypothetical protein